MKQTLLCLFVMLILPAAQTGADEFPPGDSTEILPVDEAFRFGHIEEADRISLFWQVQRGYFLYRDKLSVAIDGVLHEVSLAKGNWYLDETFGCVLVLEGFVGIEIPATDKIVSVYYQGCAAQGYCYQPQIKHLNSVKLHTSPRNVQKLKINQGFL